MWPHGKNSSAAPSGRTAAHSPLALPASSLRASSLLQAGDGRSSSFAEEADHTIIFSF